MGAVGMTPWNKRDIGRRFKTGMKGTCWGGGEGGGQLVVGRDEDDVE